MCFNPSIRESNPAPNPELERLFASLKSPESKISEKNFEMKGCLIEIFKNKISTDNSNYAQIIRRYTQPTAAQTQASNTPLFQLQPLQLIQLQPVQLTFSSLHNANSDKR